MRAAAVRVPRVECGLYLVPSPAPEERAAMRERAARRLEWQARICGSLAGLVIAFAAFWMVWP